jgi:hypothetical protein
MGFLIGQTLAHDRITAAIGAGGTRGQSLVWPEISRQRSETPSSAAHRST